MSVPLKIVLLMFISTVLGESTQDENIPSHIERRLRELEIKLAEQSVKISFLEKETSKQETAHYELVNKVAQELSQSRVSQSYEWQTRFDESIEKLQNNMKDGWLNISETWNKSVNAIANEIKSEVISNIQTIAENDDCQADKKIDLEQNVDRGSITPANKTGQWLSWGAWSYCPQMECNAHYHQSRTRACYDSESQQEVHDCIGTSLENRTCDYKCTDCKALHNSGVRRNGVYSITPAIGRTFDVFCDMDDGGWTVIQNRFDGSVNFTKGWTDYVNGFGSLHGEFWLGLDKIYLLTNPSGRMLKINLLTDASRRLYAMYEKCIIGSKWSRYTLHLGSYINGTITRSRFNYHNNTLFTTFDNSRGSRCPNLYRGGWWYNDCATLHINSPYGVKSARGMHLHDAGRKYLIASRMKLQ